MKIKILQKALFLALFVSISCTPQLYAQAIEWAVGAHGLGFDDTGSAVATRMNGDIYHTGNLAGEVTFGTGEANETTVNAQSYVARHEADGALIWVTTVLSDGSPLDINDMAVDPSGNVFIAGSIETGTNYTFGAGESNETTIATNFNSRDMFFAKFNESGAFQWVRQAGISEDNGAGGIAVDATGASYVTGFFRSHAIFGEEGSTPAIDLYSAGGELDNDIFIAKYDTSGDIVWAKSAGGASGADSGFAIDLDHQQGIYITGHFRDEATFGNDTPASAITVTAEGLFDTFIARYTMNGDPEWAVNAGGAGTSDQGQAIVADQGDLVATGIFGGMATFGSTDGNTQQLTEQGTRNLFVARYNRKGELQWVHDIYMDMFSMSNIDVGIGKTSQSCVMGNYEGNATFGSGETNETTVNAPVDTDQFFACYSASGAFQWVETDPSPLYGGAMTHKGEIVVAGGFQDMPAFGPGDPNETTLNSDGGRDIYLAKYVSEKIPGNPNGKASAFSSKIRSAGESPAVFSLNGNYPNPFNPQTTIRFGLAESAHVSLVVYDLTGKAVAELVNANLEAGAHEVSFDAGRLPSGIYMYRLATPAGVLSGRMSLVK